MKYLLTILLFVLSLQWVMGLSINRTLSSSVLDQNGSLTITLTINKKGIDGIGKLNEIIPDGCKILVLNRAGGKVLPDENGNLKIVWLTLPLADQFQVVYKLIHKGKTSGGYLVKGIFNYTKGNSKKEHEIPPSLFQISDHQATSAVSLASVPKESQTKEQIPHNKVKETDVKKPIKEDKKEVANLPKTGNYTIQLGVFSQEKESSVFKGLPDIHFVKVKNLFKYCSGYYESEQAAKVHLEEVHKAGFTGAFVLKEK